MLALTPNRRLILKPLQAAAPPTEVEITELEAHLGALLDERLDTLRAIDRSTLPTIAKAVAGDYYRQYSSFELAGRRVIYVNGFHRTVVEDQHPLMPQHDPLITCDGGEFFFGVEYYPATRTFADFMFNGRYEGWIVLPQ